VLERATLDTNPARPNAFASPASFAGSARLRSCPSVRRRHEPASRDPLASHERQIAAIFVGLRDSTRLADGRLPYDALTSSIVTSPRSASAVEAHGGPGHQCRRRRHHGILRRDCAPDEACRNALRAIAGLWQALDALGHEILTSSTMRFISGSACHVGLAVIGELSHQHSVHFLGEVGQHRGAVEQMTKQLDCVVVLSAQCCRKRRLGDSDAAHATDPGSRRHRRHRNDTESARPQRSRNGLPRRPPVTQSRKAAGKPSRSVRDAIAWATRRGEFSSVVPGTEMIDPRRYRPRHAGEGRYPRLDSCTNKSRGYWPPASAKHASPA